jgi:hypothetical protein
MKPAAIVTPGVDISEKVCRSDRRASGFDLDFDVAKLGLNQCARHTVRRFCFVLSANNRKNTGLHENQAGEPHCSLACHFGFLSEKDAGSDFDAILPPPPCKLPSLCPAFSIRPISAPSAAIRLNYVDPGDRAIFAMNVRRASDNEDTLRRCHY